METGRKTTVATVLRLRRTVAELKIVDAVRHYLNY